MKEEKFSYRIKTKFAKFYTKIIIKRYSKSKNIICLFGWIVFICAKNSFKKSNNNISAKVQNEYLFLFRFIVSFQIKNPQPNVKFHLLKSILDIANELVGNVLNVNERIGSQVR